MQGEPRSQGRWRPSLTPQPAGEAEPGQVAGEQRQPLLDWGRLTREGQAQLCLFSATKLSSRWKGVYFFPNGDANFEIFLLKKKKERNSTLERTDCDPAEAACFVLCGATGVGATPQLGPESGWHREVQLQGVLGWGLSRSPSLLQDCFSLSSASFCSSQPPCPGPACPALLTLCTSKPNTPYQGPAPGSGCSAV